MGGHGYTVPTSPVLLLNALGFIGFKVVTAAGDRLEQVRGGLEQVRGGLEQVRGGQLQGTCGTFGKILLLPQLHVILIPPRAGVDSGEEPGRGSAGGAGPARAPELA